MSKTIFKTVSLPFCLVLFLAAAARGGDEFLPEDVLKAGAENLRLRANRTPQEVIDRLLEHYGKKFGGNYVEGLAVIARIRERGADSVSEILEKPLREPAPVNNGGNIAGRLVFAELAPRHPRALELVLEAAALGFDQEGRPRESMPFHSEMSDAVFMSGPILARAGRLTGERKYFDQSLRHARFIRDLCLRKDGIYRHSPLDESAWGRGNGFPAIGFAMILEDLPADHPERDFAVKALAEHLAALKPFQDRNGMWHQVIDHPESYPEFTCTCMISVAALTGIRLGLLPREEWAPALEKAWKSICYRIDPDGRKVYGSCTGTGKQKSLQDYLTRPEINGYDDRAGSMALLFAREMKGFLVQQK